MNRTILKYITLLTVLVSVGQFTNTICVPAMSNIAHDFLVRLHYVQLIIACFLLTYGLTQLIYGPLSDSYGRRPLILSGLIIFIIGCIIAVFSKNFEQLVIASFIQGLGISVGGVMTRTVMRDLCSGTILHKANSFLAAILIIAPLIAPIVGGILTDLISWRAIYYFLLIYAVLGYLLLYFFLDETNQYMVENPFSLKRLGSQFKTVLSNKMFIGYVIILTTVFSGASIFEACASLLLGNILHYSPTTVSLIFIIPLPFYVIGSLISTMLIEHWGLCKLMKISMTLLITGSLILLIPGLFGAINALLIIFPICIYFFAGGLIFPTATTGALNPFPQLAGTAGSLAGGLPNVGAGILTVVSSTISQTSQIPLACFLVSLSILSYLAYRFFLQGLD